jgi:Concanavalin A-like lectin/glucanases superfamily
MRDGENAHSQLRLPFLLYCFTPQQCQRTRTSSQLSTPRTAARVHCARRSLMQTTVLGYIVSASVAFALSTGLLNAGQQSAAPTPRSRPTPHLRPTPHPRPTASATPTATSSATPTATPSATPTPPDNTFLTGLYAYYELDEPSGNALDASGHGRDLSQIGIIGSTVGKINTARVWSGGLSGPFLFDSSSTTTFQPGSNHLFVSCWIKSAVIGYNYDAGIGGKFVLPHASWLLFRQSDADGSHLRFVCMQDGNTIGATAIGPVLNDTNWHFVVAGWDGTNLKISVDGGAFSTTAFSGPIFGDGTGAFQTGAEAASNTWNGLIDEVAIWIGRNDLTISEVQQLYNNGAGLPFSSFH